MSFISELLVKFQSNPAFLERIELAISNSWLFIFAPLAFLAWKQLGGASLGKWQTVFLPLALVPCILRWLGFYPYDSPIALLSWILDLGVILCIFILIGSFSRSSYSLIERGTLGAAGLLAACVMLTFVGFQAFIGPPAVGLSLLIVLLTLGLKYLQQRRPTGLILDMSYSYLGFFLVMVSVPVIPYLFTPSPPDADITAMKEITGFLFQGQVLDHVLPGPVGEYFSIRYPSGLPSLAWILGLSLYMGASEVLTLIWILSWLLLVGNFVTLARHLKGNIWITTLYSLNGTFTGYFGLLVVKSRKCWLMLLALPVFCSY